MNREGFRSRLKQYKKAREENPGLKYWEWKAQPAEKDIPKYDEGTKIVDSIDPAKIVYYHGNEVTGTLADQIKHYNQFKDKQERDAYLDYEKKYVFDKLTQQSSTGWGVAVDAGELPEIVISPSKQHYLYLETEYPFINPDTPYTGHSTLYSDSGSFNVSTSGRYPNYNLFTNNCSNSTCRVLERTFDKKNNTLLFTTPGDVKDFAKDQLNAIEIESGQRGTKLHKIPVTLDQLRKARYEAYNENQRLRNKPEVSLNEFKKIFNLKYAEGGEVRDNMYVVPIEKEQVFIPATGVTKLKQNVLRKITRGGQIKSGQVDIVSPEFDLLAGIRAVATLPTKSEKLGRTLTNSDFISDDKITDLINSKHINDLTTFTKKNKGDADWYVHTDLGKSSSVFAGKGKGAYIQDKQLHPGEALIFDQKPYVWWNQGKRYTNLGENKDGYQAIVIKNNNAKDLLQVKSSQSPIGQWNGKQGFVLPSEYVTHDAVNLTPDIQHYVYDALTKTYGNVKHYAEGTDGVTGPPTYEQWYADITQHNPTILDNASMYWSIEAAKKELHKEAMKLPGYAERWTEYYRSLPKNDPDINEFVDELWANENPNNVGLKNGKYYPHKSPEGGKPTIGPGFKLGSGSHNIGTREANKGVTKTRLNQEARRIGKQHLNAVDQFLNYGQTTNPADTVSPQIKMGLMDLRHQVGPLNEWSKLRNAVLEGDLDRIKKESTVTWEDNGVTKVDKRRKKIRDEKYFYYE